MIDTSSVPRFALRFSGLDALASLHTDLRASGEPSGILDRLLARLQVNCQVSERDLAHVPREGAAVFVANHPCGMLDGAVVASVLRQIRPDIKILANHLLAAIPELREMIVPIDVIGGNSQGNAPAILKCVAHLRSGGLLVVFPAGEVARFQWKRRGVADSEWQPGICRVVSIIERQGIDVAVVPAYISGRNSVLFQAAAMVHSNLKTLLLPRELLNKSGSAVEVRIGSAVTTVKLREMRTDEERIAYLRWRSDVLGARSHFKARTNIPLAPRGRTNPMEAVADGLSAGELERDICGLPQRALIAASGDLEAYIADAGRIPTVLREIGRLREITFRAAGEGTGRCVDLDEFDKDYLHLFVWNRKRREIVGAYRLAETDRVRRLYTASLFKFRPSFLRRLGPALELGRSFVRPEYQRSFAPLLLLWKGIGAFVGANPRYKVLFGPVSISAGYSGAARELMVSFLERWASLVGWMDMVKARNPLRRRTQHALPKSAGDIEDLATAVADVEAAEVGVPVLLRQYLKLGGKLLAFSVDPEFSNALDGLIVVDLTKTEPKLLERYLGKAQSARFLDYQKGQHGTR